MSERTKGLLMYILVRLLSAPLSLGVVASAVFLLMRLTPGDPVDVILGVRASPDVKLALRQELGLTGSWWEQYVNYLKQLLQLDLGKSLSSRATPVVEIIQNFFPATVELTIYAMAIALIVGIGLGWITALSQRWQTAGRLFSIITYSLPLFWVGMLLQLVFAVQLGWFPIGTRFPVEIAPPPTITGIYTIDALLAGQPQLCWISLRYLALPALSLGVVISGVFERVLRTNLVRSLQADFVESAKARGIPQQQVLLNHALRNALIPVVTIMGLTIASLLGGAVLTEVTFSFPGLANRLFEAIIARDYPVVQGIVVFFALIVVVVSVAIDLVNAWLDPRIKF
jgi:ABC-type dipeptide/oligopeptide/nickel transport systems, permease components